MRFKKLFLVVLLAMGTLSACSTSNNADNENKSVALITDGNINDQSFNQSTWSGLEDYGEEYKLNKGTDGYQYFEVQKQTDLKKVLIRRFTKNIGLFLALVANQKLQLFLQQKVILTRTSLSWMTLLRVMKILHL